MAQNSLTAWEIFLRVHSGSGAPDGSGADSADAIRTQCLQSEPSAFDELTPEKHEARVGWREATIRDGTLMRLREQDAPTSLQTHCAAERATQRSAMPYSRSLR